MFEYDNKAEFQAPVKKQSFLFQNVADQQINLQSKSLFLTVFDLCSLTALEFSITAYTVSYQEKSKRLNIAKFSSQLLIHISSVSIQKKPVSD